MTDIRQFRAGDIVKYNDGPCEILWVFTKENLLFIFEKRAVKSAFVRPDQVEFVRRPDARELSIMRKKG